MWKSVKTILILGLLFLLIAPLLLIVESKTTDELTGDIALNIILLSILYFAFTMVEIVVISKMKGSDSPYYIAANLGFSLVRLLMTIALLLVYKVQEQMDFTLVFINVLVFYFLTLSFSTWRRQRLNKTLEQSHDPQS